MPEKRPKAIDLQHHLSDFARLRAVSPLKGLQKYFQPGSYILAGGLCRLVFPDCLFTSDTVIDRFAQSGVLPFQQYQWRGLGPRVVRTEGSRTIIHVFLVL